MATDLNLVQTHELVDELVKRMDHAVFVGFQAQVHGQTEHTRWLSFQGSPYFCLGLLQDAAHEILSNLQKGHHQDPDQERQP